ncbi:hypothetical protein HUG15_05785 [Salicibibacter cibarius]|uniref:Uncharacterized protein n=1 Tax=Salicibibacter cibarius TaxID=2743000 RepID=A0A7T6Z166_9BACI|nr:hypothetical protein [Salicibibacter cibarius]QQK75105.1 hypothetical protein HUG15_05455 [Salicibibacter cibarius]QQK75165.1 hypothetical protein HUG15_05785 [Salicibibacter cibarius]
MSVQPQQMMQQWADMNEKLQEQIEKQGEIIDRLGEQLSTQDEAVAERLQAIEDRLDEPIDTRLTGRNVELITIAEQVEIRDENVHPFSFNIPAGLSDFDIIFTDTHATNTGGNRYTSFDLYFSIYRHSTWAFGDFSVFADDGDFYNWVTRTWDFSNLRRLRTKLPANTGREGENRKRLTLEQMLRAADHEFFVNQSLQETSFADADFPVEDMKRSVLSNDRMHFNVQFDGLPEEDDIQGSISVIFRGYY